MSDFFDSKNLKATEPKFGNSSDWPLNAYMLKLVYNVN